MSGWSGQAAALAQRVSAYISASTQGLLTEPFEQLALELHRWQVANVAVVGALTEGPVARWQDLPAVPVSLFKDLDIGPDPSEPVAATFLTSGTTTSKRGVHRLRSTALYDQGAVAWARACVPNLPRRVVALLDDPRSTPTSSLSHMVALFSPASRCSWHCVDGLVDDASLEAALAQSDEPVFLPTTAFSLAFWLQRGARPLPAGSVVMVTGGFKGRAVQWEPDELYRRITNALGPVLVVTEYGMTELSSQLWGTPDTPFRPPPWLRALAVDPLTGGPLPAGERGQLRFVDLCNLDSTLAIETLDQGVVLPDGGVILEGRLPDAPLRGCSLTAEEAEERR